MCNCLTDDFFNFYSGQSSITRIQELAKSQQERGGNKRNKQNSTRMSAPLTL